MAESWWQHRIGSLWCLELSARAGQGQLQRALEAPCVVIVFECLQIALNALVNLGAAVGKGGTLSHILSLVFGSGI